MKRNLIVCMALAIAAAGCGGSTQDKEMEQAAQTAEQGAAEAAQGLEQLAKGLESMAAGGADGRKPVDPVSFRDMIALLPEVDGWEMGKPTGERMTSPFPFSSAEATYTKDGSRVQITMTDSGFNQMLLAPYSIFLASGYEKETTEGYEKSTQVNGQPGWEKWNSESKRGELNTLVGKRFLVQIEGRGIDDIKVLHDIVGQVDTGKLAGLK